MPDCTCLKLLMMGGCNTRNMQREELSEIKYLRLLHQVGVFIYSQNSLASVQWLLTIFVSAAVLGAQNLSWSANRLINNVSFIMSSCNFNCYPRPSALKTHCSSCPCNIGTYLPGYTVSRNTILFYSPQYRPRILYTKYNTVYKSVTCLIYRVAHKSFDA